MNDPEYFEYRLPCGVCKVRPRAPVYQYPGQFEYLSNLGWGLCGSQENAQIAALLKARAEQETLRKKGAMRRTVHQRIPIMGNTTLDQLSKIPSPRGSWFTCAWIEGASPEYIFIERDQYGLPRVERFVRLREGHNAQSTLALVGLLLDAQSLRVADDVWFEDQDRHFTPKTLPEGKRLEWGLVDISFSW